MITSRVILFAVGLGVASAASYCLAQPFIESRDAVAQREPVAHRVQVVNDMGYPIRVKIMGYRQDAHFVMDLDEGESTMQKFYAGQRVVCVWNRNRRLKMAASVDFDRSGVMRLESHDTYFNAKGKRVDDAQAALPTLRLQAE